MCIALPARVVQLLDPEQALVEQYGRLRPVNIQLLPEVQPGEFVLITLGLAVQRLSAADAREILDTWQEISRSIGANPAIPYEAANE